MIATAVEQSSGLWWYLQSLKASQCCSATSESCFARRTKAKNNSSLQMQIGERSAARRIERHPRILSENVQLDPMGEANRQPAPKRYLLSSGKSE